jgi:PAS domain S-box-containing protein
VTTQDAKQIAFEFAQPDTLSLITEALDVGCVIVDPQLVVRSWNRWMEAASGRTAAEAVGRSIVSLFPDILGTPREHAFRRASSGESVVFAHSFHGYLLPMRAPVGFESLRYMQQSARVMPFVQDGESHGAVAFIQDVSERIAREHELSEAKQRAETANEAKSEFLKGMSHEFRTPLNAIIGYAALLESEIGGPLTETQREHLNRMVSGAHHLANMVEEILTFASIEAQKAAIEIHPVDVGAIAAEVVSLLENQAAQKSLQLEAQLKRGIVVSTDAQRLMQILMNVIGNAIKFTQNGSVQVSMRTDNDDVVFVITDSGPGIPTHFRERIFEPFVQVSADRTRHQGTGLGLPLSRSLAELIGGTLKLEASSEAGSRFVLRIPNR